MSNIVDDLLQEVEQLEESTQQLNDNAQKVSSQNSQLKSDETTSIDADLIALETAKTAQEASLQSHLAAKAAIKMAEQLKSQSLELEEFNYNWRQSIRTTSKEIQSAKTTFIALMTGSVVVNVIALSVIGYFFYETNKQNSQFKGETLDIIQIESNLLSKKITLKVDELSSLIEALSADIMRMKKTFNTPITIHPALNELPSKDEHTTLSEDIKSNSEQTLDVAAQTEVDNQPEAKQTVDMHTTVPHLDKAVPAVENHTNVNEYQKPEATPSVTSEQMKIDYTDIKKLVEKILAEQQKLQATTLASSATTSLMPAQVKKLNDISWIVRKQEKTLKAIQASLASKAPLGKSENTQAINQTLNQTLNELKVQLRLLTEQQLTIQGQVKNLQTDLTKYTATPAPYSYKAK